jgi:predicted nuclease of predicted toxin-antitoxin system
MKFLCDVHRPIKLVKLINENGFLCVHINTILDKWFTKDEIISNYADQNDFILITKDADFRNSYFLKKSPKKLVKINLGNISNTELLKIIDENLIKIEKLNEFSNFILEIDKEKTTFSTLKVV